MNTTEAYIALNMIPGMGPVRLRKLLERFGSPTKILGASTSHLTQVEGIGPEVAANLRNWENLIDLKTEIELVEQHGVTVLTLESSEYPAALKETHSPPIVLYIKGELQERDRHAIGVVGSRKTTHYGIECAKKLSYQLAYSGLTVVSGLARGIDTAAHQAALAAKGRTIAVLGSGLLELYPPENAALAEKITESGAVVSEFPMRTKPDRQTFPMRNRIVSGWAFGILVIEAGLNSGALITANQALEQGRTVYAVPGPIDKPTSMGSNRLIQQGAKLVLSAKDVLDDFGTLFPNPPELAPSRPSVAMNEIEKKIYDAILEDETSIDTIVGKTRLPIGMVSSSLLGLEMKRLVKQLPGNRFVKLI
jgi:DNA processing protein